MERDQDIRQQRATELEPTAATAPEASSAEPGRVQFKTSGAIPAVGGAFQAQASDTDAAYEPTGASATDGAETGAPVQLLAAQYHDKKRGVRVTGRRKPKDPNKVDGEEEGFEEEPLSHGSTGGGGGPRVVGQAVTYNPA